MENFIGKDEHNIEKRHKYKTLIIDPNNPPPRIQPASSNLKQTMQEYGIIKE
jgi:hypothetical protein